MDKEDKWGNIHIFILIQLSFQQQLVRDFFPYQLYFTIHSNLRGNLLLILEIIFKIFTLCSLLSQNSYFIKVLSFNLCDALIYEDNFGWLVIKATRLRVLMS